LESAAERLALNEARARLDALHAQVGPLEAELQAAGEEVDTGQRTVRGAVSEASAQQRAAEAAAELARERSRRIEQLSPVGGATEQQRAEAAVEVQRVASEAEAATFAVQRTRWEQLIRHADARTRVEAVRRELAQVQGEALAAQANIERLREELERRVITSPVDGRVAEIEPLSPGRFVVSGAPLLSILPRGDLRIVAHFAPGQAFGRIRARQPAQMRLDGFPWTRFGMLNARVARVADETGPDGVRVELALRGADRFPARLEHGLPGTVEIQVEDVSPAELLLRAAGRWLEPQPQAHAQR
jgi:membrane fusion protein (multidrug efflux system)